MHLYYTIATGNENPQSKPSLSLGGYKSSTRFLNSQFDNLFGEITPFTVSQFNQNQYRGLILKNELGLPATDIFLWFVYPASQYAKLRVSAIELTEDSEGNFQMEHIDNGLSKPVYATFFEADGEANKVNIGSIGSGEMLGIWFERELIQASIAAGELNIYGNQNQTNGLYEEVIQDKVEEIEIHLSWS